MGDDIKDWWRTSIIAMEPEHIELRGRSIQEFIGNASFAEVVWLLTCGDMPSPPEAKLLEVGLVAAVDHGPQVPSIAAARMAVMCGLTLNGAFGTGAHMLDDVHGGPASRQSSCSAWLWRATAMKTRARDDRPLASRARQAPARFRPPLPPRGGTACAAPAALVDEAATSEIASGQYAATARALETELAARAGRKLPLNIDGVTAVVYAELGLAAPLARGLSYLSRAVARARAWLGADAAG